MSSEDGCPLCGKPVLGRTALLGHLEFAHDIDTPGPFLEELLRPDAPARRRGAVVGALARRAVPVLVVAVLAGGSFVAYQQLVVDAGTDTAAAGTADVEAATTTAAPAPETTTTAAPTTTTTAAPTTTTVAPTTTTAAPTTTAPAAPPRDVEFRKPFLLDARHEGCRVAGAEAVHTIAFRFSGSRNITFDGTFHPDRTGDGPHTTTHAVPVGDTAYFDHVVVVDPAGEAHQVEISPPVHLGAC